MDATEGQCGVDTRPGVSRFCTSLSSVAKIGRSLSRSYSNRMVGVTMLKALGFQNYRCFQEHEVSLQPKTVIVGENNAGKSTVIEGFRLVAIISERYDNLNFRAVPNWLEIPLRERGVAPSLAGLELSWENLFHHYRDPPAQVYARFATGQRVTIHLGPDGAIHAVLTNPDGSPIRSKGKAKAVALPRVSVLPQIAPLARSEEIRRASYIRRSLSSHLAPLHFRNQLNLLYDQYFDRFRDLVETSWHGVQIVELTGRGKLPGEELALLVRDGDFVAEVAWMGHGLQMWLQTMWFIARTSSHQTVVLDEPDVYMHPDLQRKLFRMIYDQYDQVIVATHSTEILAEAEADNVLILDKRQQRSKVATALPAVQSILNQIGSAQNLQLTRLWTSKRLLLLEGNDLKLLKRFHELAVVQPAEALDAIPNMSIGGWSGWPYAVGSAMLLQNAAGEAITVYCLLDSDYHTPEEQEERLADAEAKGVNLHIWQRKEIENYLLVPETIQRVIAQRVRSGTSPPSVEDVVVAMESEAEKLKDDTFDAFANEGLLRNRAGGIRQANRRARSFVNQSWKDSASRLSIVSGKAMLSGLSAWSKRKYGVSFAPYTVAAELRAEELADEALGVIRRIDSLGELPWSVDG